MIKSKLSIALLMASSLPIGMQANNIIESGDTSRVYDIDEVVVIDQPKEAFRLRQQPLSSTSFNGDLIRSLNVQDVRNLSVFVPSSLCLSTEAVTHLLYICAVSAHVSTHQPWVFM